MSHKTKSCHIYEALLCVSVWVSVCLSVLAKNLPLPREAHLGAICPIVGPIIFSIMVDELRWKKTIDGRRPSGLFGTLNNE